MPLETSMPRSEVRDLVVMIPMRIKVQTEGDHVVAVLPGWILPINNLVTGLTESAAVEALQEKMRQHWGVPKTGGQV